MTLCLLMGINVSAQNNVLYEKAAGSWTSNDVAEWIGNTEFATASVNAEGNLYFSASNTSYEFKKSISFTNNSIITLTATWNVGQSTGRAEGYNYMKIGGVEFRSYGQDQYGAVYFDGAESKRMGGKNDVRGGEWIINLTINQATGECEYTINMSTSGEVSGTGNTQITPDGLIFGFFKPGRVGDIYQTLKDISVSEKIQSVQTATYTVQFKTTTGTVLASETRSGVVGSEIILTSTDTSDHWFDGVKYIYMDDDADTQTIAANGSTIVTIYLAEATKAPYTLTAVDEEDNVLQQLASGEIYEGESALVYYSKGLNVNGTWYLTAQNATDPYYGINLTGGQNAKVTFTPSDISYFAEVEDLTPSHSWAATGSVPGRYSNGLVGRLYKESYVKTDALPAGIYTVTLRARNQSGSQTATLPIHLVDTNGNLATTASGVFEEWAAGQQAEMTVEGVVVPEGYAIAFNNATEWNSNLEMDYVMLVKTGNPELAQYVVKFVDESGKELKPAETREGAVGVEISLAATDKDPFTVSKLVDDSGDEPVYEEITYIYVSDDSEGKVVAQGAVVTITYREAADIPYTITAVDGEGNELGVVAQGEIKETMSQVVYYTKAVEKNGQWYAVEQNATDPYYGITVAAGENPTIVYQAVDYDYFSEIEDLTPSHSWAANGAFPGRYANGIAKRLYKDSYVKTDALPAGKYTITVRARNNSRNNATLSVGIASTTSLSSTFGTLEEWGSAAQAEHSYEGINVPEGFGIAIVNTDTEYNSNLELDYLYVKRTGDFESLLGDVNGDGVVSITDAALIVDYCLTGVEPPSFIWANADLTKDKDITITDATMVIEIALGNN